MTGSHALFEAPLIPSQQVRRRIVSNSTISSPSRCLFDRPDPIETQKFFDEQNRLENERFNERFGINPETEEYDSERVEKIVKTVFKPQRMSNLESRFDPKVLRSTLKDFNESMTDKKLETSSIKTFTKSLRSCPYIKKSPKKGKKKILLNLFDPILFFVVLNHAFFLNCCFFFFYFLCM